jgi:EAL domain-containing protein (putative c-di-GMP-specific phosphodiesterase class I)
MAGGRKVDVQGMQPSRLPSIGTARAVIATRAIRSLFQPIVDLDTDAVVGYEALSRGPADTPLELPLDLFAAARAEELTAELDALCRVQAFHAAVAVGLLAPLTLFVNVEPEVLDGAPFDELVRIAVSAPRALRVVFEITERAISARPAELLRTVERIREHGWAIALDDVGADPSSLAFMALLRPEVVKLDLRLIHERPTAEIAGIMHAVNAYTESSGALLLAEGIETAAQRDAARGLGAHFGQGWLFGRPSEQLCSRRVADASLTRADAVPGLERSPFECLAPGTPLRRAGKRLLIELSKQLEQEAIARGETAIVAAAFQEARHFTAPTAERYRRLVAETAFVSVFGEGLTSSPIPGVRGAPLQADDPVVGEWDVIVLTPHFAAALLARDLGDGGPDLERRFEYALTYRRDVVVRAARALLSRVTPGAASAASGVATPFAQAA